MPTVSVITPCYNAGRFIVETLQSVAAQSFADWEHMVVDDGSLDDSAALVEGVAAGDPRVRLLRQANGGVSRARNAGFAAASPDSAYLLFLDADDLLEPDMLAKMVGHLEANPAVGLVHCLPFMIDETGGPAGVADQWWPSRLVAADGRWGVRELTAADEQTPWESVYALAGIVPSLAVIRRSAYESSPGWDESFGQPCEDTDLFLSIALNSKVHFLPEVLVNRRMHGTQSVTDLDRLGRQTERLYSKWRGLARAPGGPRAEVAHGDELLLRMHFRTHLRAARKELKAGRPLRAARSLVGGARRYALPLLVGRRNEAA
jgi:glycosyltransferase involved in cell wall biosynthesis